MKNSMIELSVTDRLVLIAARAGSARQITENMKARIANGQDITDLVRLLELDLTFAREHFDAIEWPPAVDNEA